MVNISFDKLGTYGRLGNQLFQIAATTGIAERNNAKALFPEWQYGNYFKQPIPQGATAGPTINEESFDYNEPVITGDCNLLGYFQSEKYFPKQLPFEFKDEVLNTVRQIVPDFGKKPAIFIHIRRGDYVNNPNYYNLPITYFIDSLIKIPGWESSHILIASDNIDYCRVHFSCLKNAVFVPSEFTDIETIALASLCDNFIISNSSFSWWCARLGEKKHSTIIHPGHLFAGKLQQKNDTKDYWPERWTRNQKESYKLNLKDTTFTIPVFYDHVDRKQNIGLSLCMLQKDFDSNFIVGEQGGDKFQYMQQYCKYVPFSMNNFHRTKMLNDMAIMAGTDIVANWDCDVIVPPMQIYITCLAIRNGADMVFPYSADGDGSDGFARMNRVKWFGEISKALDIGIVGNAKFTGKHGAPIAKSSVGGAVFFNRDSFIDGGMENENMISFGPEDCERNDRFKELGYDVQRVSGYLYHIDHWCGPNSGASNPFFRANHAELEKIRLMSREQLREYVDSWPWCHKYTSEYYGQISEGAIRSAKVVLPMLGKPGTVIDIGCGVGEWNNGNIKYFGVDYKVNKNDLLISFDRYVDCNLNKELPPVGRSPFDLCLCLEVAEHLRPHRSEALVKYLCSISDRVLFSAAIPYQGGNGHVNEQWQSYWGKLFADNGFGATMQKEFRNLDGVDLYYRQNMVLYERGAKGQVEDFVLPEYYIEIVKNAKA